VIFKVAHLWRWIIVTTNAICARSLAAYLSGVANVPSTIYDDTFLSGCTPAKHDKHHHPAHADTLSAPYVLPDNVTEIWAKFDGEGNVIGTNYRSLRFGATYPVRTITQAEIDTVLSPAGY